jgi:phage shock protein C
MRRKFFLNKRDGKLMGVCAGLADYTGIDALWIRIATALAVLAGAGSLLLVYVIVGLVADSPPVALGDPYEGLRRGPDDPSSRRRERDSGFGDIESYYASSNPRLSREIDGLR